MNSIGDITFICDTEADICFVRQGKSVHELTIKGSCEYQGEINGTWFQLDELTKHWITFRWNRFQTNIWQAFYKCIDDERIIYYRRFFARLRGF